MESFGAPGTETYDASAGAAEGNGWYAGETGVDGTAGVEQTGFSIPTTGQANGGGPMRSRGGASQRFNPLSRKGPAGDGAPATAATAEKNEQGFIIFAYNIGYQTDEAQLHTLFATYGSVAKVNVIQDFATGQGKGFGFVTMPNAAEAEAAISSLNGADFHGNTLQVRFKTPKGQGPPANMRGRGGFRGGPRGSGFRGVRGGGIRGSTGYRGGRGAPRGGMRGRGRGGYGQSSYDSSYGSGYTAYDGYSGYESSGYAGYDYGAAGGATDPYGYGYSAYPGGW